MGISHSVTYCIQFHSYYCKPISATWVCISAVLSKWRRISSITCYARGTASRGACPPGEGKRLRPLMRMQCLIIAFGGLEIFCQGILNQTRDLTGFSLCDFFFGCCVLYVVNANQLLQHQRATPCDKSICGYMWASFKKHYTNNLKMSQWL